MTASLFNDKKVKTFQNFDHIGTAKNFQFRHTELEATQN